MFKPKQKIVEAEKEKYPINDGHSGTQLLPIIMQQGDEMRTEEKKMAIEVISMQNTNSININRNNTIQLENGIETISINKIVLE
jgi:hypothetical protein